MTEVNFAELQRLDAEVEEAIEGGTWTPERFASVWARGLAAANGQAHFLGFIRFLAHPDWTFDGLVVGGRGMHRVPTEVAAVIERLRRGWVPRVVLEHSTKFIWNGAHLDSAIVDLPARGDVTLIGRCTHDDATTLEMEMDGPEGRIVRNESEATFRGNWKLALSNAAMTSLRRSFGAHGECKFELVGGEWNASRGTGRPPRIWCAVLSGMEPPFGNLRVERSAFVSWAGELTGVSGGGWGNLRVEGAHTYYLIKTGTKQTAGLVVHCHNEPLTSASIFRDLEALQYVLGRRFSVPRLFGVSDGEVTAVRKVHWRASAERESVGMVVAGAAPHGGGRIANYFRKLTDVLHATNPPILHMAMDAYLGKSGAYIDGEVLELQNAISALARVRWLRSAAAADIPDPEVWSDWLVAKGPELAATLGEKAAAIAIEALRGAPVPALHQIVRAVTDAGGLTIPDSVLHEVEVYRRRLQEFGLLAPAGERDDAESARERAVCELLRSILVALISLEVGYEGPIRSAAHDSQSPEWWPDRESSVGPGGKTFVASRAPQFVAVPAIGSGTAVVFVGPSHHADIIRIVLKSCAVSLESVTIVATDSRDGLREVVKGGPAEPVAGCVVSGSDMRHSPDAVESVRRDLAVPTGLRVCPAVSDVESWLLADDGLLRRAVQERPALEYALADLPPPDEVEDPLATATLLLGPPEAWAELEGYDVYRAAGRSWSLRQFVAAVTELLGIVVDLPAEGIARTLSREVIGSVVRELMPAEAIAWRTSDGASYSAASVGREIESGTELGRQYARDVLRVAVDFLAREARRRK